MGMKLSEREIEVLEDKAHSPQKQVLCPRCGKELYYHEVGNSYEVKCPTEDCIGFTVRGI